MNTNYMAVGKVAAADLTEKQNFAVRLDANGKAILNTDNTKSGYGQLLGAPDVDETAEIVIAGIERAVYGAAVTAGDDLMVDANGKLIPATTGLFTVAKAEEDGANGEVHFVKLQNFQLN